MTDAVGLVCDVKGGPDIPFAPPSGLLFEVGEVGDVVSGVQADEEESVAETGPALAGDLADAAMVATF